MGTSYDIITNRKDGFDFTIDEHSNKLDISIDFRGEPRGDIKNLTPEELISAAFQMLTVASYWCEEGTVEKMMANYKKGYHW